MVNHYLISWNTVLKSVKKVCKLEKVWQLEEK